MIDLFLTRDGGVAWRNCGRLLTAVIFLGAFVDLSLHAEESSTAGKGSGPHLSAGSTVEGATVIPPKESPAEAVPPTEVDVAALLTKLAMKANGGDETAAKTLTTRLLEGAPAKADAAFAREVEAATRPEASRILGLTLLRSGKPELQAEGLAFLRDAVKERSVLAMEVMARILLDGEFGQTVDLDEAIALLRKARQLPGAAEAYRLLGDLSLSGKGLPKDAALAIEYYRQGAEAGSIGSMLALHRLFLAGDPVPKDLAAAEHYGRVAAERAGGEATLELVNFYEREVAGAPNWALAGEWLRRAADQGNREAARRLADYYLSARPGFPDPAEGIRLLRAAAGQGDAEACFRIGRAYQEGVHLPLDPVASSAWFRIAGDFGFALAENAYGLSLMSGYGVASNPTEAVLWFKRAADHGLAEALLNLAILHEGGVGVEVDEALALKYYRAAAIAGLEDASSRLTRFLDALPPARRTELERANPVTSEGAPKG